MGEGPARSAATSQGEGAGAVTPPPRNTLDPARASVLLPTMAYTIKEWPTSERPRERLATLGPRALSPRELLAILLETGTRERSALDVAGDVLRHFAGADGGQSLRRVMTSSLAE